jgi:hypothetical protein
MEKAGPFRHIGEGAVSVVAVDDVLAPVGDEQVIETIIVIVAHGYGGCPAGARQARFPGNIRECPIAIVLIQAVCSSGRALDGRTAEQKDVEPPIVVVVEERRAAAYGFEDIGLGGKLPQITGSRRPAASATSVKRA